MNEISKVSSSYFVIFFAITTLGNFQEITAWELVDIAIQTIIIGLPIIITWILSLFKANYQERRYLYFFQIGYMVVAVLAFASTYFGSDPNGGMIFIFVLVFGMIFPIAYLIVEISSWLRRTLS